MNKNDVKMTIQLVLAVVFCIVGIVLIFISLFIPPKGVIDSSVLVAFGEMLTFAGSVIGIDYHYRFKQEMNNKNED